MFSDYFDLGPLSPGLEKFSTLPRTRDASAFFMPQNNYGRPVSTAGVYSMPVTFGGGVYSTPRRPVSTTAAGVYDTPRRPVSMAAGVYRIQ